jgi:hypothetical protein
VIKTPGGCDVVLYKGSLSIMQLLQIDLVPGESVQVGSKIVTLVAVEGNVAHLHVEDTDHGDSWSDPTDYSDCDVAEPAFV